MTKRDEVLQAVPEGDRLTVSMLASRRNNQCSERPSDSARWAVRQYELGRLEGLRAEARYENRLQHRRECQFGPRYCERCKDFDTENPKAV